MEPEEYDDMLQQLVQLTIAQSATNAQQGAINERLTAAIERLDITVARIETILTRMLRQGDNGQEA